MYCNAYYPNHSNNFAQLILNKCLHIINKVYQEFIEISACKSVSSNFEKHYIFIKLHLSEKIFLLNLIIKKVRDIFRFENLY